MGFSLRFNEKFGFLRVRHEWNKSMHCVRGLKKFPPESHVEQGYKTGERNVLNMVCKGKKKLSAIKRVLFIYLWLACLASVPIHGGRIATRTKKPGGELWVAGGRKGMQAANLVSVYWITYKFLSSGIAVH